MLRKLETYRNDTGRFEFFLLAKALQNTIRGARIRCQLATPMEQGLASAGADFIYCRCP